MVVIVDESPQDEEDVGETAAATEDEGAMVVRVVVLSQDVDVHVADDACVVDDDCEVVTAAGVCRIGNRSLLLSGSRAD